MPTSPRTYLRFAAVTVGGWAAVGLLFAGQEVVVYGAGRTAGWTRVAAESAIEWGSWMVVTPLVVAFARAYPITRRPRSRTIAAYAAAGLAALVLDVVVIGTGHYLLPWHAPGVGWARTVANNFARLFAYDLVLFTLVAAAYFAVANHVQARERQTAAARLSAQLAAARLDVLTMQLQPHFLFNTLNTIAGLVRSDPRGAERMIAGLGDLLRMSLRAERPTEVPLGEEGAFLARYLEIQQMRFDERLTVALDIAPDARATLVPPFLLQPLVENALQHAVAVHAAPVTISVTAARRGDRLAIVVRDDGPGFPADRREGIGLANTRARLEQLYPGAYRFSAGTGPHGGAEIVLELPAREHRPAQDAA